MPPETGDVGVLEADPRVLVLRTRMPFRYGIATLHTVPHVILRLRCRLGGSEVDGYAAEHLAPKWFTKDPSTSAAEDAAEMQDVVLQACRFAVDADPAASAFDLSRTVDAQQREWGAANGLPGLLAGLGSSLVERAVIDAVCRSRNLPFAEALRAGELGFRPSQVYPELDDALRLPERPLGRVTLRHTVGLSDPLTPEDDPGEPDDGLPRTLTDAIRAYGLTHFKVKVSGRVDHDLERLRRVEDVLRDEAGERAVLTLDGNEQFDSVEGFRELWDRIPDGLRRRVLFVEQPLHRDVALGADVAAALNAWSGRPPVVIDESDGSPDDVRTALEAGYAGTSHKNCKGVFAGVAKACLLAARGPGMVLCGEDLTTVAPVGLQQDLAVMATLGVRHVERNGHHYFRGLEDHPPGTSEAVLGAHPGLFAQHAGGLVTLQIREGELDLTTVNAAPFGTSLTPMLDGLRALADWSATDLQR